MMHGHSEECGHRVCSGCIVPLCTSTYLSSPQLMSAFSKSTTGSGKEEEVDDGEVKIECRVCHHVTSLCVWDVITGSSVDITRHDSTCSQPEKCILHPDRPLERFCVNDNLLVCLECALEQHRTHELMTITRQAQTAAQQVPGMVDIINWERALMEDSVQETESTISALTKRQRRVEENIKGTFNRLMKALQKKENMLLANTSKFFETRKRALELQIKCTHSIVSHLNDSQNNLKNAAAFCQENSGMQTSLVVITRSPVLMKHSKPRETSLVEPLRNTLSLLGEGRFHINKEDVTPTLKCIGNLSISRVGEEQFALQTMRLFVEGDFKHTFENCLEISKRKTHNQSETVALVLLDLMLEFKPSLIINLGPFTKLAEVEIEHSLPKCSPESLVFFQTVTDLALSLAQQPPKPATKEPPSKFWSLFWASSAPEQPILGDHTPTTVQDWRCGVAALVHVMRGYMYMPPRKSVDLALKEYYNAISLTVAATTSSCLSVPRALAEFFLGLLLGTKTIEHWEVSARLGNVWAQHNLGWLAMASDGGSASGRYMMAELYQTGCAEACVRKDMTEAMRLCTLAAEQGHEMAMLLSGRGRPYKIKT
ncbi:hypothetical protein Pelo_9617 [Pelomyxa schiedti]|nr:hypothetical protein Pelo_9617 [Pelomyxa schiedti]